MNLGEQLPILDIKYNIELLLLFFQIVIANFNTREQVCEEFHVLYRTWTLPYILVCVKVFGDTRFEDETIGKSAPFFI